MCLFIPLSAIMYADAVWISNPRSFAMILALTELYAGLTLINSPSTFRTFDIQSPNYCGLDFLSLSSHSSIASLTAFLMAP